MGNFELGVSLSQKIRKEGRSHERLRIWMSFVWERKMKGTDSVLKFRGVGVQMEEDFWDKSVVMSQFIMKKL